MSLIQIRVDSALKQQADMLFAELGLDTTTAMRIFLKTAVREQRLPFEVTLNPKEDLIELQKRLEEIKHSKHLLIHKNIDELEALENA